MIVNKLIKDFFKFQINYRLRRKKVQVPQQKTSYELCTSPAYNEKTFQQKIWRKNVSTINFKMLMFSWVN